MKDRFNQMVGLTGDVNYNAIGSFTSLTTSLATLAATTTTSSGGSTSISTLTSKLSALQSERTALSQKIVACETEIARLNAERGNCKRFIGWDNGCLDTNTRLTNEQQSLITAYKNRIAAIDLEIPKI
jgi:outer membrane murein-binding lipoprotein Lpp